MGVIVPLSACILISGCGAAASWRVPASPPRGLLFTAYRAPLTTEFQKTPAEGRVGTASTLYVRDPIVSGFDVAWEDASINTAAHEGEISHIYYADYDVLQILGIFGKFTTRVYGE